MDVRECYRLIDRGVDVPQEGDEVYLDGEWYPIGSGHQGKKVWDLKEPCRRRVTRVVDVGEGYRLIDREVDVRQEGDEIYLGGGVWQRIRAFRYGQRFPDGGTQYRRRLMPAFSVGEGWRSIGKGVDVVQEGDERWVRGEWIPIFNQDVGTQNWRTGLSYRRRIVRQAKVGEFVRVNEATPFAVAKADATGVCDILSGPYAHGSYKIVRRVVRPWTFQEACKAFFVNEFKVRVAGLRSFYPVDWIGVTGIAVGPPSSRTEFTYRELMESFETTNGEPCGTVEWRVVE